MARWTSIRRCRRAVRAARNASPPEAGGFTCVAARAAATSVAVIRRRPSTQVAMRPIPATRSSRVTSPARTGSGTTRPRTSWMGRSWLRPAITRLSSQCPGPATASPEGGSNSSTDGRASSSICAVGAVTCSGSCGSSIRWMGSDSVTVSPRTPAPRARKPR